LEPKNLSDTGGSNSRRKSNVTACQLVAVDAYFLVVQVRTEKKRRNVIIARLIFWPILQEEQTI
jgi:hypothetical protein